MNTASEKAILLEQSRALFDENECGGLLVVAIDETQTSIDVAKFGIRELDSHGKQALRKTLEKVIQGLAA